MRELAKLLFILGGISGFLLFLTLAWEAFSRGQSRRDSPRDSLSPDENETNDWDPFAHLAEAREQENTAVPGGQSPLETNLPSGLSPGLQEQSQEQPQEQPQESVSETETPESLRNSAGDPWKALMQRPKKLREIGFDSGQSPPGTVPTEDDEEKSP